MVLQTSNADIPQPCLEQFAAVSSIFDAAEIVLYVSDMETHELLFLNAQGQKQWGANRTGEPCFKVLQADRSGPCEFCTNPRLVENGRAAQPVVWEFQNTVNRKWYLCIDKAIPWSDGRLVRMEVAIDITERKLHEQFREQYVGLISHDLRTPISTIGLSASILKTVLERAGVPEGTKPVEAILRNTRRMAEMIEDLLETTRLESGQLQLRKSSFDLVQLVDTVAGQLGASASRTLRVEANSPAPVVADAGRIERVLENLIGNAFLYSPPDLPVQLRIEANGRETIVKISDRGTGVPAGELPKLFQRFYRAIGNDSPKGLGLGLYNSRIIVEGHGGRIWAESSPGGGSTFAFALPVSEKPDVHWLVTAPPAQPPPEPKPPIGPEPEPPGPKPAPPPVS